MQGTPDPLAERFEPLQQRVATSKMYTGNGFMPDDYTFFHSQESGAGYK